MTRSLRQPSPPSCKCPAGMHTVASTPIQPRSKWLTALGVDFVQSNAISPAVSIDSLHKPAGTKI